MVDQYMGGRRKRVRKCLLAVAAFVTISGSAQANADDEILHVGPYCISHDEKGQVYF